MTKTTVWLCSKIGELWNFSMFMEHSDSVDIHRIADLAAKENIRLWFLLRMTRDAFWAVAERPNSGIRYLCVHCNISAKWANKKFGPITYWGQEENLTASSCKKQRKSLLGPSCKRTRPKQSAGSNSIEDRVPMWLSIGQWPALLRLQIWIQSLMWCDRIW